MLCGTALAALGLTAAACSGPAEDDGGDSKREGPEGEIRLGAASAVPVGGAKLYAAEKVLVAQVKKDEFTAFSAVCTHQSNPLGGVEGKEASCPRHGSRFRVDSGEVTRGPATAPLRKLPVSVEKDGTLLVRPSA
ncbi:Rieske (2Fe-2S) protein [Streptomyces sp. AJS327]|nr:Rieske (2Fe-2S) protein [Streptomyces sp. AJS327]